MPIWIVLAGAASIVLTAGLAWVLWRINAPRRRDTRGSESGATPLVSGDDGRRDSDGGSDGGDGGGD